MADNEADRVKLSAWVTEDFRTKVKQFCLSHGDVDVQDVLRALVEKLLAEEAAGQPSAFVKEILDKVHPSPPADTEGERSGKIIAMPQPQSGPRGKRKK
jgi:hypothetical protein